MSKRKRRTEKVTLSSPAQFDHDADRLCCPECGYQSFLKNEAIWVDTLGFIKATSDGSCFEATDATEVTGNDDDPTYFCEKCNQSFSRDDICDFPTVAQFEAKQRA